MHFTREPVIETVITPREGYKLLVRSTKNPEEEEVYLDAIEIVSFGHSIFYRSLDKPKVFLVPVSDYEVFESKEVRTPLKAATFERNIKIGGGRDAPPRREEMADETQEEQGNSQQRRDRGGKRRRRRDDKEERAPQSNEGGIEEEEVEVVVAIKEPTVRPPFTGLIPPPTTLISDSIEKYKKMIMPSSAEAPVGPPQGEAVKTVQEEGEAPLGGEASAMHSQATPAEGDSRFSNWLNFLS